MDARQMKSLHSSPFSLIPFLINFGRVTTSLSCPIALSGLTSSPHKLSELCFHSLAVWLSFNFLVQTPDHRLYPTSSFSFLPLGLCLQTLILLKHNGKRPLLVLAPVFMLLLQKVCGEAEGTCGCLDLHVAHQDAFTPPPHLQR